MSMKRLTALQASLAPKYLNRGYTSAKSRIVPAFREHRIFAGITFPGLEGEVMCLVNDIRGRVGNVTPEVTILDVGCGTGKAIEECARMMPRIVEDILFTDVKVRAIGVDLNPMPEMIDDEVFCGKRSELVADIHEDDVLSLSTIEDSSVDILYSIHCLEYVEDSLRAIESGWRVLKPGGVMVWQVTYSTICDPDFKEILLATPGGVDVFDLRVGFEMGSDGFDPNLIVARKWDGAEFEGFPFECVGNSWSPEGCSLHYDHIKVGKYVKKGNRKT